jgi:hypothetical protein
MKKLTKREEGIGKREGKPPKLSFHLPYSIFSIPKVVNL